jgi:eukaryotic-like serine/threonine-protein kinase
MTSQTPDRSSGPSPVEATINGRYQLTAWLSRTPLADEYLAHDLHLDRSVVFKALLPALVADRGFLDRFRSQAQATANLNHPAIAAVLDWGRDQSGIPDGTGANRPGPTYYMVSEHVEGRSLSELVSVNGPMPPERVAHVIIGTTAALGFAHRAGIVDGGLNPDKIRVSSTGVVKVVDLGLLRALGTGWIPTDDAPAPAQWMAPEQFRGDAPSERTDVYQVGLIAYFLATGKTPYSGNTVEDLRKAHQESVPVAPTKASPLVPKALESFIGRSMAKSPDDRYSSVTEQRGSIVRLRDRLTGSVSVNRRLAAPTTPDVDATAMLTTTAGAAAMAATAATTAAAATEAPVNPLPARTAPQPVRAPALPNAPEIRASSYSAATYDSVTHPEGDDDTDQTVAHLASDGDFDEPEVSAPSRPRQNADDADATKVQKRRAKTGAIQADANLPTGPDRDFDALDKRSPRRGLYALTLLALLVVLGGLLFLLAKQLGVTGTTTGSVEVPMIEQRPLDEAKRVLTDLGLRVETERVPSGSVAADIVVKQTPTAGARVSEGSPITLQVSTGSTKPTVPKVVGLTVFQAQSQLAQFGLTWQTREKKDDVAEAGTVVSQEPRAESVVAPGAMVTLDVAVSSSKKQVPKVDGKSVEEARVELTREGFLIVVQSEPSNAIEKGTVIRTEPGGGASVAKGSSVLIVSSGGKAITVPVVIGKDENSAREALQALGLIVVVKQRAESDVAKVGKVVSQTPDTGDVEVGATVTIRVGVEGAVVTTTKPAAEDAPEPVAVEPEAAPLQTVATAAPTTAAPTTAAPTPAPEPTTAPAAGPVPAAAATTTVAGATIPVVNAVTPTSAP